MHMVIDKRGYDHLVSSQIGDEESVIIKVSNGLVMPSFAGVYSCHQLFWRVHVIAFIWSGRGNGPFFHFWRRGHVSSVFRVRLVGGDAFEMGLVGVPSTGVGGGGVRGTCGGFLCMIFSSQSLKNHGEIGRGSYQVAF